MVTIKTTYEHQSWYIRLVGWSGWLFWLVGCYIWLVDLVGWLEYLETKALGVYFLWTAHPSISNCCRGQSLKIQQIKISTKDKTCQQLSCFWETFWIVKNPSFYRQKKMGQESLRISLDFLNKSCLTNACKPESLQHIDYGQTPFSNSAQKWQKLASRRLPRSGRQEGEEQIEIWETVRLGEREVIGAFWKPSTFSVHWGQALHCHLLLWGWDQEAGILSIQLGCEIPDEQIRIEEVLRKNKQDGFLDLVQIVLSLWFTFICRGEDQLCGFIKHWQANQVGVEQATKLQ